METVDSIVVEIGESGYQDGQLGAGHPAEEYRKYWVSKLRTVVAKEILAVMESNNDPWRNHIGVVKDYLADNIPPERKD